MMRKNIAILLALALLFGSGVSPVSAAGGADDLNKLTIVAKLGILDALGAPETERPALTRGEAARAVARLLGWEQLTYQSGSFADVPDTHPYHSSIMIMKELGIMIGEETGYFRPDGPITYPQAVKILLHILGYSPVAEGSGGYPAGHLFTAGKLGLLQGVGLSGNEAVTKADFAYMIYNCFDVALVEEASYGPYATYSDKRKNTLLSKYHGIERRSGVLNGTDGITTTNEYNPTPPGMVMIDGESYYYDDFALFEYAGYEVEYYVREDGNKTATVLYAFPTSKNSELILSVYDLDLENPRFSLHNFVYWNKHHRTETAELVKRNCFVFNGAYYLDFDRPDLEFDSGYIKLVDNNNDGVYDLAFVWSFDHYIVSGMNDDMISCMYNMYLVRNEDAAYRVQNADGSWGGWDRFSGASSYDVISLAKSKDGDLITAYVIRDGVAGTVQSVETDTRTSVTVDGASYYISKDYLKKNAYHDYVDLAPGLDSEFYFGITGEIVAVYKSSALTGTYGYLLRMEKEKGISDTYKAQIYDQNGKLLLYTLKSRLRFDDAVCDGKTLRAQEVYNEFKAGGASVPDQLVLFDANESREITAISKAVMPGTLPYNMNKFSKDYSLGSTEFRYQDATFAFGDADFFRKLFRLSESTKIFIVPTEGGAVLQSKLSMGNIAMFTGGSRYKNIDFYDCDETSNVKALVYKTNFDGDSTVKNDYFIAVTRVYTGLDGDGASQNMLKGYYQGSERTFAYESKDGTVPRAGGILFSEIKLSGELQVSAANVIYDPGATAYYHKTIYNGQNPLPLVWSQYGVLYRKNGSDYSVFTNTGLPSVGTLRGCPIYRLRVTNAGVLFEPASSGDLIPSSGYLAENGDMTGAYDGSKLVVNNRYEYAREIFIIDNE